MAIDYNLLKLANIFGPQQTPPTFPNSSPMTMPIGNDLPSQGGITGNMPNTTGNEPDLMSVIQGLLNPKDEQFNNYSQMINQMPKRSDYKPTIMQRLAAIGANLATATPSAYDHGAALGYNANIPEGIKAQQEILNEPYNRALSDWSNKLDPMGKIAQMEQSRNINNRLTGMGALQKEQQQKKIDEQIRKDKEHEIDVDKDRAIRQQRANAYDYRTKHPNHIIKEDSKGQLVGIDPTTNESEYILDENGEVIKSSNLTPEEKANLKVKTEKELIQARGVESRKTDAQRAQEAQNLKDAKATNRTKLKTTPSDNKPTDKPLTPNATKTARVNRAIAIVSEHPELKSYFVYGTNKQPTGELLAPKNPEEPGFLIAQRLISQDSSDTKLSSDINPQLNIQPSSAPNRELTRPTVEDPKIKAARAKVDKGYVLITDGKSFGQIKPEDVSKMLKGWMVVK